MTRKQKIILGVTCVIALIVFAIFILPNSKASENVAMVQVFQPDESAPLPALFNMIAPSNSVNQALRNFIFYKYYFYGFPYFGISALFLLPFSLLGKLNETPLVMLVLRQFVSVLPMLVGLLLLVYMQDQFRTYRSPVLFIFLAAVPAVIENNFWWHPDGITFLLVVLTLFFLWKDNLRLGRNFVLAAVLCGIATAAKLIGVYFFLTVGFVLLFSLIQKKANWKKAIGMGLIFIIVMAISFVIANPFLLSHWARTEYINTFRQQTDWLSEGYGVVYAKGLSAAWPLMRTYFGGWIFLLAAIGTAIWSAIRGTDKLLQRLILLWFLPVTVVVLWITHFKFQYWMPAAIPLFSTVIFLLPEKWNLNFANLKINIFKNLISFALLIIIAVQFGIFVQQDIARFISYENRAQNSPLLEFYQPAVNSLSPIANQPLHIYYDFRLYLPDTEKWTKTTSYELLDYAYIKEKGFDVLMLLEQRIKDYTNPNVKGIDPLTFVKNQRFYRDAESGTIENYHLVYRSSLGLVFVRDDLYLKYYPPAQK